MIKDLEILVALIFLFIGVFFIFNARGIVRKKLLKKEGKDENKIVQIVKVIAYFITVLALIAIYFLIRR